MKYLVTVALLAVAAQATLTNVEHVMRTMPEVEGAPVYNTGGRIIYGNKATRGQFPYQAALYLDDRSFCGGSLISTRWVLTAGHCASGISTFNVHLGAQNLNNVNSEPGRVVISTTQKIVHSDYNATNLNNDIALINLGRDVALSEYIDIIGIASNPFDQFVNANVRISGWGKTSDDSNSISAELNYIDLFIINNNICQATFGDIIITSTICARDSGPRSICNGDSGSPLIHRNIRKQIGVASFVSSKGCESKSPNGFARVNYFASWISSNTGIDF